MQSENDGINVRQTVAHTIQQLRCLRFIYKYAMNSHQLEEVDSYPYLGVEISANLRLNIQVDKA